jgi:hypothetical protein
MSEIDWFNRDVSLPALVNAINQKFATFLETIGDTFTEVNNNIKDLDTKIDTNYSAIIMCSCSTGASTKAKVVKVNDGSTITLKAGLRIAVKFTSSNTASGVTLNVGGTGAKQIWYNNAAYTSTSNTVCGYAKRYTFYTYDGTYWVWSGYGQDSNTTYTNVKLGQGYGICDTEESETAKEVVLASYVLTVNGIVVVKFANAVSAGSTMSINALAATPIYYRGEAIIDGIIKAGDIAAFIYDGTNYILFAIDRTAEESGSGGGGLDFKPVSTEADQGLSDEEKLNARNNIGAGTSSFSGAYSDLTGKPTIPTKTSELTNDSGFGSDFSVSNVTFNSDGSITETGSGSAAKRITTFGTSNVVETYYNSSDSVIKTVTTTFNSDGSISITTT